MLKMKAWGIVCSTMQQIPLSGFQKGLELMNRVKGCRGSYLGFQAGSMMTTRSAAVSVRPRPPTCDVSRKTGMSGSVWNSCKTRQRRKSESKEGRIMHRPCCVDSSFFQVLLVFRFLSLRHEVTNSRKSQRKQEVQAFLNPQFLSN